MLAPAITQDVRIFDDHGRFVRIGQSQAISGIDGGAVKDQPCTAGVAIINP